MSRDPKQGDPEEGKTHGSWSGPSCQELALRIIEGVRPADDAELAAHVGSCLRCFRTVADMRDVPQLQAALRSGDLPDPGDAFWARFPTAAGAAWEQSRRPPARPEPTVSLWDRLRELLRLPAPAALAGAALAATLAVVVMKPAHELTAPATPPTDVTAAPASTSDESARGRQDDAWEGLVEDVGVPSAVEQLEELGTEDLKLLARALSTRSRI